MKWLKNLFTGGATEFVEKAGNIVTRFAEGHLGKKELAAELENLAAKYNEGLMSLVATEIQSKERVMVAELEQGDTFTKRARPSIIYTGLVGAIVDAIGYINFDLPSDFWYVWGGVCGVYAIGRSVEKVKTNGKIGEIAGMITGKARKSVFDD